MNSYLCHLEWTSVRQKRIKEVEALLKEEPQLLTFFGNPVAIVEDYYVHIGVPQATRQQSQTASKYRISKGKDISYKLQDSTKNSLLGISPVANRKMFTCYQQPTYVYGMDTINLNKADIDNLERSYRKVIKHLLCLPDNTPSAAVYLTFGVLPFEAQRDLEVLGLLGQLSVCPEDLQNVKDGVPWPVKSVRNMIYLTSLDIITNPWRPDR